MRCLASVFIGILVFIPVFAFADSNSDLLKSINAYRVTKHLNQIKEDSPSCTVATIRAIQIMSDYSHDGFYPLVRSSWVPQGVWYENLAQQYDSTYDVLGAWKKSTTHNKNLLAHVSRGCVRHVGAYWTFEAYE